MVEKITTPITQVDLINKVNEVVDNMQTTSNIVATISPESTDSQYPSAKCVFDNKTD